MIENNEITGGQHAISIRSAEDVTIRKNIFHDIREAPVIMATSRRVWISQSRLLVIPAVA